MIKRSAIVRSGGAEGAPRTRLDLEIADGFRARSRGLLGRYSLRERWGLWLSPCNAVHCCFMRFSIDVLYLDAQQNVIRIRHRLRPWRWSLCWRARSVIELAAGECRRLGIQPGDNIQCE